MGFSEVGPKIRSLSLLPTTDNLVKEAIGLTSEPHSICLTVGMTAYIPLSAPLIISGLF